MAKPGTTAPGADGDRGKPAPGPALPMDLSAHLPSRLIFLANGLALHAYRLYSSQLNLRSGDWRIISALGYFGPVSYYELAVRISMDRAGISRTVASLVRRRLIRRVRDARDGRHSMLLLTAKGVALHDEIAPIAQARQRRLVSVLAPAELEMFEAALEKLQRQVDEMLRETMPAED